MMLIHRSDFTGAATAGECLLLLSNALPWKSAITHTIAQTVDTRPEASDAFLSHDIPPESFDVPNVVQEMNLSSIFGLLVMAGFPKVCKPAPLMLSLPVSVFLSSSSLERAVCSERSSRMGKW